MKQIIINHVIVLLIALSIGCFFLGNAFDVPLTPKEPMCRITTPEITIVCESCKVVPVFDGMFRIETHNSFGMGYANLDEEFLANSFTLEPLN